MVAGSILLAPDISTAQSLPVGWSGRDIGSPSLLGRASYRFGTFTLEGGGPDVWGTEDAFYFVQQPVSGDVAIVARVASVERTNDCARAGVMIRESLASNARHVFMIQAATMDLGFQRRVSRTTTHTSGGSLSAPAWVKLVRQGSTFTALRSSDGVTWSTVGSETISIGSTVYVGLAVTSCTTAARATGTFTNVSLNGVPWNWSAANVGDPSLKGATLAKPSGYTAAGAGYDISGTSDQFMYLYRRVSGDVSIVTRVTSVEYVDMWTKAGPMIRESLRGDARHASLLVSAGRRIVFQRRTMMVGNTYSSDALAGSAPIWLKLDRRGRLLVASRSADGSLWTIIGTDTIDFASDVYVGLAVTSHDSDRLATAAFMNTTITAPSTTTTATNTPPAVSLMSPASDAIFGRSSTITMSASASDVDGSISRVDFYAGSTFLGSDTSSPYTISWLNVAPGTYTLTAAAHDNAGATTTSAARTISVGSAWIPKTLAFTPSSNTTEVTSYLLEIFTFTADPSTATPVQKLDLGKPSIVNGQCTVDVSTLIHSLPGGTYIATVTAIGPGGEQQSAESQVFTR
jgi:regulation of enolase protein 1 (concanavalin A-like superfamily)